MSEYRPTYGTISWARLHLKEAPDGCAVKKDCPDCAYANREVRKAAEADWDVLERSLPPAPSKPRPDIRRL
jgi:hypothetical protein